MKSIIQAVKRRVRKRLIRWIATGLEEYKYSPVNAAIMPTTRIMPEASVVNMANVTDRIKVGNNSILWGRLLTHAHGGRIEIGEWCSVGLRTEIWSSESISIGNRVLISHDVNIIDATEHSRDSKERHLHFQRLIGGAPISESSELPGVDSAAIVIEDDVWISLGVTILKGVRIGAGSIIAANSLVTKDVPAGVLYRCSVIPIITPLF